MTISINNWEFPHHFDDHCYRPLSDRLQPPVDIQTAPASKKPEPARWPRWLNRRDVAEYLGVSVATIDKWTKEGRLPAPIAMPEYLKRWDKQALDKALDTGNLTGDSHGKSVSNLLQKHQNQPGKGMRNA